MGEAGGNDKKKCKLICRCGVIEVCIGRIPERETKGCVRATAAAYASRASVGSVEGRGRGFGDKRECALRARAE